MTDHGFPTAEAALLVDRALDEDLSTGTDVTNGDDPGIPAVGGAPRGPRRRSGGGSVAALVLDAVAARLGSAAVEVLVHVDDGARVRRGDHLATLRGSTRTTLVAERTVLNVLSRTSGVATHTSDRADVLEGSGAMVLDTRKTTPGLRALEKYAVRCGGGTNKRMGLYDVAMIKDNHKLAAGRLTPAYDAISSPTWPSRSRSRPLPGPGGRRGAVPVVRQHVS